MKIYIKQWTSYFLLLFLLQQTITAQCNIYSHSPASITLGGSYPDEQQVQLSGLSHSCDVQYGYPPLLEVVPLSSSTIMVSLSAGSVTSPTNVDVVVLEQGQGIYSFQVTIMPDVTTPPLSPGSIYCDNLSVGYGQSPGSIKSSQDATGGNCTIPSYSWQSKTENSSWVDISGSSNSYSCPALTETTSFRRKAICGGEDEFTIPVTISVGMPSSKVNASSGANYIISYSPQEGVETPIDLFKLNLEDLSATVQYFDGLGRPKQSISVAASPDKQDIVQPIVYDLFGHEEYRLLPYTMNNTTNKGAIRDNPDMSLPSSTYIGSEHHTFYVDHEENDADKEYSYAQTIFEASPLSREVEQGAPGADWQPNTGGFTIKTIYGINAVGEVRLFNIDGDQLVDNGYYQARELYKTTLFDENWEELDSSEGVTMNLEKLHTSEEFKDKLGQVVLKRSYVEDGDDTDADVDVIDTYYVYDKFSLLRYVLPPEAINRMYNGGAETMQSFQLISGDEILNEGLSGKQGFMVTSGSSLTLDSGFSYIASAGESLSITTGDVSGDLVYCYKYDGRKRMIEKKIPAAAPVYMVYDERDRLVATQDGNMRDPNNDGNTADAQWLFTKYDAYDRPVMTGLLNNGIIKQSVMQTEVTAFYPIDANAEVIGDMFESRQGELHGYTNVSFPDVSDEHSYLSITYYDNYSFPWTPRFDDVTGISDYETEHGTYFNSVTGQVTAIKVQVMDETALTGNAQWLTREVYYDDYYRVIKSINDLYPANKVNGKATNYEVASTNYNFTGQVENSSLTHYFGGSTKTIDERFEYDHAGRLLRAYHNYNGAANDVLLVEHSYNELGELVTKRVGGTTPGTGIQQIDYKYNIRGWLTSINDDKLSGVGGNKKFAMKLDYNNPQTVLDANAQYNGNISSMNWRTEGLGTVTSELSAYGYQYDALNRLTAANYGQGASSIVRNTTYDVTVGDYDFNGNIGELKRNKGADTAIDDLIYVYEGNQLLSVNDGADDTAGFTEKSSEAIEYLYDRNGNLVRDDNRELTSITYNHLNLPELLTGDNNKTILHIYDANGQKLAMTYHDGAGDKTSYYAGLFIYDETTLKQVLHAEGHIDDGGVYQYYLKDHLGNTRVMVSADNTTNQINTYYPFGMNAELYQGGVENSFRYNGKELQDDEIGSGQLDWYDYGARFYDPALGRWHCVDPQSERYISHTPYAYVANNPMLFIDPNGEEISFRTEHKKDDDGNYILDDNGNKIIASVTIVITGKVMNTSDKDVNMDKAINRISSQISNTYNGKTKDGIEIKTEVNLSEAKSMDDVADSDHVFALASFKSDKKGNEPYGVVSGKYEKVAFLNVDYYRGPWDTTIGNQGPRTAAHELGHLFGLNDNTGGIMNQSVPLIPGTTHTTKSQLSHIYGFGRLSNKKSNFVPIMIFDSNTGTFKQKKVLNHGKASNWIK